MGTSETALGTYSIESGNIEVARIAVVVAACAVRTRVVESFKQGKIMKPVTRWSWTATVITAVLAAAGSVGAQTAPRAETSQYQVSREVTLVGTVSSVIENSKTGPLGTHVMVQSASGLVDVHVGSAKYLEMNKLNLKSGDSVRIIGENFEVGAATVFYARIVQDGTSALAVRSTKGMPLWKNGKRLATNANANREGAL